MARARRRLPGSARAIAAYNCGARMAAWCDPRIADMVNHGESIRDYMTQGELHAYRLTNDREWWYWWHCGYQIGAYGEGI